LRPWVITKRGDHRSNWGIVKGDLGVGGGRIGSPSGKSGKPMTQCPGVEFRGWSSERLPPTLIGRARVRFGVARPESIPISTSVCPAEGIEVGGHWTSGIPTLIGAGGHRAPQLGTWRHLHPGAVVLFSGGCCKGVEGLPINVGIPWVRATGQPHKPLRDNDRGQGAWRHGSCTKLGGTPLKAIRTPASMSAANTDIKVRHPPRHTAPTKVWLHPTTPHKAI